MAMLSLVLICPRCGVKNYLDPYPFWDFSGRTKCAGCDTVYFLAFKGGHLLRGPEETTGEPELLPGYAETVDFQPIIGPGKTRPAPRARPDVVGKPKPITHSIRGRPVSGRPLRPEELVGSRPKVLLEEGG